MPPSPPPLCKNWCSSNTNPWPTKCGFLSCAGCPSCYPAPAAPPVAPSPPWPPPLPPPLLPPPRQPLGAAITWVQQRFTNWVDAREACQGLGRRWQLAILNTTARQEATEALTPMDWAGWLGAYSTAGVWYWMDGTEVPTNGASTSDNYEHWAAGEPNANGRCAYMAASSFVAGYWLSGQCSGQPQGLGAFCEGPTMSPSASPLPLLPPLPPARPPLAPSSLPPQFPHRHHRRRRRRHRRRYRRRRRRRCYRRRCH
eukprot:6517175-Prymnesium_polylepis.1